MKFLLSFFISCLDQNNSDVERGYVARSGVVSEWMMKKVFEKNDGKNRAPYETLRRIFFQ